MLTNRNDNALGVWHTKTLANRWIVSGLQAIRPDQLHRGDLVSSRDGSQAFATSNHMNGHVAPPVGHNDIDCGWELEGSVVKEDRSIRC